MASKSVKFVVIRGGRQQLLFSVKEIKTASKSGGLIITFNSRGTYEDGFSGSLEEAIENRITVHANREAGKHYIHSHIKTRQVDEYDTASVIELNETNPFWLIGSAYPPTDLTINDDDPPPNFENAAVISAYDAHLTTFGYLIVLSRVDLPSLPRLWNVAEYRFTYFTITVVFHHVAHPASLEGYQMVTATSGRRVANVPDGQPTRADTLGVSPDDFPAACSWAFQRLSVALYRNLRRAHATYEVSNAPTDDELRLMCCFALKEGYDGGELEDSAYPISDPTSPDFDIPIDPPKKRPPSEP